MTDEREAMTAATHAARKILAQAKNPRTVLHTYSPTAVAFHAAYAAVTAYKESVAKQARRASDG